MSLNFVQSTDSIAKHVIRARQGNKVKYSNRNNSTADCPISLKFRTEFDRGEVSLLYMFKVKAQRSRSRGQVQCHSVT